MKLQDIKSRIENLAPGTTAEVRDLTGTEDHWAAEIVSTAFAGLSMVKQHQLVFALFKDELASGELHAFTLKTKEP